LGGDFVAHIFDPKQAVPTMRALAQEFNHAFPHAQFVLVLGNEDSSCGDYQVSPNSPFLRAVAQAWEPLVNRNGAAPGFAHTFPAYGSYVTRLPSPGLRAIVLDDVFWSPRYRNAWARRRSPRRQRSTRSPPRSGPTRTHRPRGCSSTFHRASTRTRLRTSRTD
jgi:hypothetical protein